MKFGAILWTSARDVAKSLFLLLDEAVGLPGAIVAITTFYDLTFAVS